MSRLIFKKEYVIVLPSYEQVEFHKHMMQHVFFGLCDSQLRVRKQVISGSIIYLDSNIEHSMKVIPNQTFFLLVDTTSTLARQIRKKYFVDRSFAAVNATFKLHPNLQEKIDEEIFTYVEQLLEGQSVRQEVCEPRDQRIEALLSQVKEHALLDKSVSEIADQMALSHSRLTHLFKQETGVTLKNYMLLSKLEKAYHLVMEKKSITDAALEAGFSDSAHLAAVCKQLTGISLSAVMK